MCVSLVCVCVFVCVCVCVCLTKAGSLLRQDSVNSLKLLEKSPLSVGAGDLGMWNSTRIGCMSEFGGSPLASSMAVMPSDQISAWRDKKEGFSVHLESLMLCFVYYSFLRKHECVSDKFLIPNRENKDHKFKQNGIISCVETR